MIEATDQSLLVPPAGQPPPSSGPNVSGAANAAQAAAAQPGMTPPPQEAPAPAPAKRSLLGDIVSAVGGILGGPSTRREVDPKTGAVNEVPRSRASRIGNAAGILLRGAAAGAGAHPGPGFVGRAAAAGMQEEQGTQQQQQQNLMQESENVRQTNQANQQQQLVQASLAKSNQDIARTTLQMRAEKQALDEHQVAIANSLQGIANLPGALKLAHFDSNADINSHLEQVGADLSSKYAVDMAKNEIRLVPSPSGGFDAYQVPKDWHSLPVGDGQKVHVVKYGSDKEGKPTAQMQEIAAPQSMNWGDQQQWESEQFKTLAGFNASQAALKASAAETKLKGAQTGEAVAGEHLKEAQAKNLAGGGAKNDDGSWNPSSIPVSLVEATMDPSQLSKRTQNYNQMLTMANQYSQEKYGKPYDIAQAQSDYKFATSPQTQNVLKYLNSLTGADNKSGNLGALVDLSNQVKRTDFPALNNVEAWAKIQTGDAQMAQYYATVTEVADQVAKILQGGGTGSGTSDAKLKQASELFDKKFTKEQVAGISDTLRTLLANRKSEFIGTNRYLQKQYGVAPVHQQTAQPDPQTHVFSVGGWQSAHPGQDVNAAKAYAAQQGYAVTQ